MGTVKQFAGMMVSDHRDSNEKRKASRIPPGFRCQPNWTPVIARCKGI